MEIKTQEPNELHLDVQPKNPLFRATTFSKYFALTLFVALPFIGGWIGYSYALNIIFEKQDPEENLLQIKSSQSEILSRLFEKERARFDESNKDNTNLIVPQMFATGPFNYFPLYRSLYGDIYVSYENDLFCTEESSYYETNFSKDISFINLGPSLGFTILGLAGTPGGDSLRWVVSKTSGAVYLGCKKIAGANPINYTIISTEVSYSGNIKLVSDDDRAYFTMYGVDENNAYFAGEKISGSDGPTFVLNPAITDVVYNEAEAECPDDSCPFVSDMMWFLQLNGQLMTDSDWQKAYNIYKDRIPYDSFDKNHKYFLGRVVSGA